MVLKRYGTWRALLLLLPLVVALPLASRAQPEAQQPAPPNIVQEYPLRHYQLQFRPDMDQIANYNAAIECWELLRREQNPGKRADYYDCAERHLLLALDGPSSFPEATLALAHLYYTRNRIDGRMLSDAYRASYVFAYLGGRVPLIRGEQPIRGAIKSEALTYLGILDLRGRRWSLAKQNFEEAMRIAAEEARRDGAGDPTGETLSLTTRGDMKKMVAGWRYRLRPLECVNRVGSVLATFYMANHPADPAPGPPQYRAVLDEMTRLLPPDVVARCEPVFNGDLAAIWRFPERTPPAGSRPLPFRPFTLAYPDWSLTLNSPRPEGVEQVSLADFVRAIRIWAGAELAPGSPEPPAGPEGLALRERYNLGARLLRDLLDLEAKGQYQEALRVADRLAQLGDVRYELFKEGPEVAMPITARQHRIWIRLDYLKDLDEARRLIMGPDAAEDPDLYNEHFTLAERYLAAGNMAGAEEQLRIVLNGQPRATEPKSRAWQEKTLAALKPLAAWNLSVMALNLPINNDNPDVWLEVLRNLPAQNFPAAEYRDPLRFFAQLRLAEAYVRRNQPQQAEEAMRAAEQIAALRTPSGAPAVVGAEGWLDVYRRHLAEYIFAQGQENQYQSGFLTKTSYGAELRAYEASEIWRRMTEPRTPEQYEPVLAKLRDALKWVDGNTQLRDAINSDIAAIEKFKTDYPVWRKARNEYDAIVPIVKEWNAAADASRDAHIKLIPRDRTKAAMGVAAYQDAIAKWQQVLRSLQGMEQRFPGLQLPMYDLRLWSRTDTQQAAEMIVACHMRIAETYLMGRQPAEALRAYEAARDALNGPLEPARKSLLGMIINHNIAALGGAVGAVRAYQRFPGGTVRAAPGPFSVVPTGARTEPDPQDFMRRLRGNPRAQAKLLEWFNRGYLAGPAEWRSRRVRKFRSTQEMMAYLEQNLAMNKEDVGLLRRGTRQYAKSPRTGRWVGSRVKQDEASYHLRSGLALFNAACGNLLSPMFQQIGAGRYAGRYIWTFEPYLQWRHEPFEPAPVYAPRIEYTRPVAEMPAITFGTYGYAWAPWIPSSYIIEPKFVLLARSQPLPKLILPYWWSTPPLCSPRRVTIGRISSIDDAHYPLHVDSGTAENRRRKGGSPRGAAEPVRKFPYIIPPGPDFNPYYDNGKIGYPYGPPNGGPGGGAGMQHGGSGGGSSRAPRR